MFGLNSKDCSPDVWLDEGDIVTIYQGIAHQLEALEDSIIFETSTQDKVEDSYRVWKGDSQK